MCLGLHGVAICWYRQSAFIFHFQLQLVTDIKCLGSSISLCLCSAHSTPYKCELNEWNRRTNLHCSPVAVLQKHDADRHKRWSHRFRGSTVCYPSRLQLLVARRLKEKLATRAGACVSCDAHFRGHGHAGVQTGPLTSRCARKDLRQPIGARLQTHLRNVLYSAQKTERLLCLCLLMIALILYGEYLSFE